MVEVMPLEKTNGFYGDWFKFCQFHFGYLWVVDCFPSFNFLKSAFMWSTLFLRSRVKVYATGCYYRHDSEDPKTIGETISLRAILNLLKINIKLLFKKCLNYLISFGFSCNRTCRCNSQRVSQMWTRVWKLLPWRHPASRRPASRRSRSRSTLFLGNVMT